MRTRGINFWENKILKQLKTTDQQFVNHFPFPKNPVEEQNYEITSYFVHQQQKMAS